MVLITLKNKLLLFFGMSSIEHAGLSKKFLMRPIILLALLLFLSGCSDSLPDGLPDNIPATGECSVCHGSTDNAAPPLSINDSSSTSDIAVGAHQTHMKGGEIRAALACGSCHTVPQTVDQPGHRNGLPAEIVWSSLAQTGDLTPIWNRTTATCSSVYCHGATLSGGTLKNPVWTVVNSTQNACGTCHGNPPPSPHAASSQCYHCHSGTVKSTGEINVAGGKHINGVLESSEYPHPDGWAEPTTHGYEFYSTPANCKTCHGANLNGGTSGGSCDRCHTGGTAWRADCLYCHGGKDSTNGAPPYGLHSETVVTNQAVGAHTAHLSTSTLHAAWACSVCHTVPGLWSDAGHIDGVAGAELHFSSPAGNSAAYTRSTATCSSVYCHGATLSGGTLKNPVWNVANPAQSECGTCHGNPPPAPHENNAQCNLCHPGTVKNTGGIDVSGGKHINGIVESVGSHPDGWAEPTAHGYGFYETPADCKTCHGNNLDGGTSGVSCNSCHTGGVAWRTDCTYCHGGFNSTNGAPPYGLRGETAVTNRVVGAHTAHLTSSPSHTAWACSVCHTVPGSFSDAGHIDGVAGAEVHFSSPAGGSAAYTRSTASCSSLYCHGNGRTVSGAVLWTSSTDLTCRSCHGYYTNPSSLSSRHNTHISEGYSCNTCHKTVINSSNTIIDKTAHINGAKNVSLTSGTYTSSTKTCSNTGCHESEHW